MSEAAEPLEKFGHVGKIPVHNLWLLMLYAAEFKHKGRSLSSIEDNPDDIPDLVAEVLAEMVAQRLRRNLNFNYEMKNEVLSRVRGRIDFLYTARHQLLQRGKIACRFEALNLDVPRYRYVRHALEKIAPLVKKQALRSQCAGLAQIFRQLGVKGLPPTDAEAQSLRYNHYNKEDKPIVDVAHLALNLALLNEGKGNKVFLSPNREEHWVRKLFEKAVLGFYKIKLASEDWKVHAPHYHWPVESSTAGIKDILPIMRTDIVLENKEQRIVIDTKFTSIIKSSQYKDEILKSGYIYQIYAYLRSQEKEADPLSYKACGLLLHPAIDQCVDESALIQGHDIRFATVNLATDAKFIRNRLKFLADLDKWAFS